MPVQYLNPDLALIDQHSETARTAHPRARASRSRRVSGGIRMTSATTIRGAIVDASSGIAPARRERDRSGGVTGTSVSAGIR